MIRVLGDEGFRLFFPLCALYAALWPAMWVLALGFDLPLSRDVPPSLWHSHEMLFGAWGAALLGFITTAVPEWTDSPRLQGRALFALAWGWALGRVVGLWGWEATGFFGALPDLAWMAALWIYLLWITWRTGTDRLWAFLLWIGLLVACFSTSRFAMARGEVLAAQQGLHLAGFTFLGLLGLALARITVPVTNLVLDPSEDTSPFRPHPGRMNLAPGLVFIVIGGELAGLSPMVSGFLFIAAGAGFMDRIGEHFIGVKAVRTEILVLGTASFGAGVGLVLIGASRLGTPISEIPGLHLALMGGLGFGVFAVLSIAGRLHADLALSIPPMTRVAALCLAAAVLLRALPILNPGLHLASLLWALAFLLWLWSYRQALFTLPKNDHGS